METSKVPRQRRNWVPLAVGGSAVALLIAILTMVGVLLVQQRNTPGVAGGIVPGWREAASQVRFQLYEPGYLPPGAGAAEVRVVRPQERVDEVGIRYSGALRIEQSPIQSVVGRGARSPATVRGTEEAYFVEFAQRTLVVRKGGTWISLSGAPDVELVRIAESLSPV